VKCSDLDPRALLAHDSIRFVEPEYLNDLGFQLAKEVTALRDEVSHFRQELRWAIELADCEMPVPYEALLVSDPDRDEDPGDISNYLAELNEDQSRLMRELQDLRLLYSDQSKRKLDRDITFEQTVIAETELELAFEREQISALSAKLEELMSSPLKKDTCDLTEKAKQLTAMLKGLKSEESDLLDQHQQFLNKRGTFSQEHSELLQLQNSLRKLSHVKQRKRGEMDKLIALQKYQLAAVADAVKETRRNEVAKKETAAWRDNFRQQQALAEQNESEQQRIEEVRPPDLPRASRRSVHRPQVSSREIEVSLVPEEIHLG
jgi:hypothetical protein